MDDLEARLQLRQLELDSLLDITNSINNQPDKRSLYRIYLFTLIANFKVNKLLVLRKQENGDWQKEAEHGLENDLFDYQILHKYISITHITFLKKDKYGFDFAIPVTLDKTTEAIVFIRGLLSGNRTLDDQLKFIQTLSNILFVAVKNIEYHQQQLERELFKKELEIAQRVQTHLFPSGLPENIVANYYPHQFLGGDYYDYIKLNQYEYILCIGDVSGKGISAALLMSNVQAALRILAVENRPLTAIIIQLNKIVQENTGGEKFITFFLAKINTQTRTIHYLNAGHNPPLLIGKNGTRKLETGSTLLGIFHELPHIQEGYIVAEENDLLFCYTDGLTDAFSDNQKDEELIFEKVKELNQSKSLTELNAKTYQYVVDNGKLIDDITLLSCRIG